MPVRVVMVTCLSFNWLLVIVAAGGWILHLITNVLAVGPGVEDALAFVPVIVSPHGDDGGQHPTHSHQKTVHCKRKNSTMLGVFLKGLFTNFENITFFCVPTKETFFVKGPSR